MKIPTQKDLGAAGFGLAWLIFNAAGWGLGFGMQLWLHFQMSDGLSGMFSVLIAAAVVGLTQWLALRWLLPRLGTGSMGIAWVILTMFGYAAGFLAGSLISERIDAATEPLLLALLNFAAWGVVGLTTGFLQWSLLQIAVRGAPWWIGATTLGYGLGGILLARLLLDHPLGALDYGLAGLLVGAATLVAIARLRRPLS